MKKQIEEKKPEKGSMDLKDKKITLDAQERSLQNQLKTVQDKKKD